jgi:hypothetical protein
MPDLYNPIEEEFEGEGKEKPNGEEKPQSPEPAQKPKVDLFGEAATSGDLNDFLENAANTPKQAYNHSDTNPDNPAEKAAEATEAVVADGSKLQVSKKSKAGAQMVTKTIDFAFSRGAALITHSEAEKWKASKSDEEELLEAWALYIEQNNMEIPVWLQLVILNLVIYGFRVPDIIKARKEFVSEQKKRKLAADQKNARERAAMDASKVRDTGNPANGTGEGGSDSPPNPGSVGNPAMKIVYTQCKSCGKDLTEVQILRGAQFCCTAHSNKYRAEQEKKRKREEILNQSQQS